MTDETTSTSMTEGDKVASPELFDNSIKCPECSFEYNRFKQVTVLNGASDDYYSSGSLKIRSFSDMSFSSAQVMTPNRIRGLGLIIQFECEGGHVWKKTLAFHKGVIFTSDELDKSGEFVTDGKES